MIPLWLQKHFINEMDYVMFYFHINDLLEEKGKFMSKEEFEEYFKEPGTFKNRLVRYFKANIGKGSATKKLANLMKDYDFINVEQAASVIDWNNQPIIEL